MTTPPARPSAAVRIVDVVVSALADATMLRRCIEGILHSRCETRYAVTVVAGGGLASDETLGAGDDRVRVVRCDDDPDFAAGIERALARHGDRDVVVLRPDARVSGDWLDRLIAHAIGGADVVATFTNAGGVATYPCPHVDNPMPDDDAPASIDAFFARANPGGLVEVSGAFGPCTYVTRTCIAAVGGLAAALERSTPDAIREFVVRAGDAGYRSHVAGDVFVAAGRSSRKEGDSRSALSAAQGVAATAKPDRSRLSAVPPPAGDSTAAFARRVDLARLAASPRPAIVFIAHGWTGGVRRHIDDLAALVSGRADVLVIEPADDTTIRLYWPRAGECFSAWYRLPDDLGTLSDTLRAIGVARLHYHHVHALPRSILSLPAASGLPYDCTLHDYFPICPQYHLVDEHGRYCGEPDAAGCAACLALRPGQWGLDITKWRSEFGAFLHGAARVIAPSHDVEQRIRRYFPSLAVYVWPHPETPPGRSPRIVRVVTLGTLSPEKGLRVVDACGRDAAGRGLPLVFRVLGAATGAIALPPEAPVTIHGSYPDEQLPRLLAAERADVIFFPAQVPETWSYTLSVALGTDTPIVASRIGAIGERLAGRARVRLLPFDSSPAQWNTALLDIAGESPSESGDAPAAPIVPGVA